MLFRSRYDQRAGNFLKQRISIALQIGNAACFLGSVSDRDVFEKLYHIYFFETSIIEAFVQKILPVDRDSG